MKKSSPTRYNILIVCEGSHTEPNYFKKIKEEVDSSKCWTEGVWIEIRPKPQLEEENEIIPPSRHKTPRAKRQLKNDNYNIPIQEDVESEYKAVPTRYVREAQKGLEDGSFDEAWAVFDKDQHPQHAEAFKLANTPINGKCVQIAFSSISFEHWILLHFEKNMTPFNKSECKENKKTLNCGTGEHDADCRGNKCVAGYMRHTKYLPDYSKGASIDLYSILKDFTNKAIENASWLRSKYSSGPVYEFNPYSDVDVLVKKLLRLDANYVWLKENETWENNKIQLCCSRKDGSLPAIMVCNKMSDSYIFQAQAIILKDDEISIEQQLHSGVISPGQQFTHVLEIGDASTGLAGIEARILMKDGTTLIVELMNDTSEDTNNIEPLA